jgi:hypothetical protein
MTPRVYVLVGASSILCKEHLGALGFTPDDRRVSVALRGAVCDKCARQKGGRK